MWSPGPTPPGQPGRSWHFGWGLTAPVMPPFLLAWYVHRRHHFWKFAVALVATLCSILGFPCGRIPGPLVFFPRNSFRQLTAPLPPATMASWSAWPAPPWLPPTQPPAGVPFAALRRGL